ncbi:MAG: hypothetical protein MMC33_001823 [Icmadophila ericetorum]|nr:hypothetical protein [Icmadophila ericetorum]
MPSTASTLPSSPAAIFNFCIFAIIGPYISQEKENATEDDAIVIWRRIQTQKLNSKTSAASRNSATTMSKDFAYIAQSSGPHAVLRTTQSHGYGTAFISPPPDPQSSTWAPTQPFQSQKESEDSLVQTKHKPKHSRESPIYDQSYGQGNRSDSSAEVRLAPGKGLVDSEQRQEKATECQEEEIVSKTAGQTDGNAGEINPVARADLKDVADPKDVTDPKGVARSVSGIISGSAIASTSDCEKSV